MGVGDHNGSPQQMILPTITHYELRIMNYELCITNYELKKHRHSFLNDGAFSSAKQQFMSESADSGFNPSLTDQINILVCFNCFLRIPQPSPTRC